MVRHSHENALTEDEFEALLQATDKLPEPASTECVVLLLLGGRLGMRAGEIAHMRRDWIDYQREQITIPSYQDCTKGRNGDACGYCRSQARQAIGYDSNDNTLDEELSKRWKPKTQQSARTIPFGFSDRVEACLREYFSEHEQYQHCRSSMNRRMDELADAAGMPQDELYPHCLRATAATYHAFRGLSVAPLQALMGWADMATAKKYIRLSGGATAKALNDVHADD